MTLFSLNKEKMTNTIARLHKRIRFFFFFLNKEKNKQRHLVKFKTAVPSALAQLILTVVAMMMFSIVIHSVSYL